MVQTKAAGAGVCKVALQGVAHGVEGDLVPRNFGFGEEAGFHGFMAGVEGVAEQFGAVEEVNLAYAGDADEAE